MYVDFFTVHWKTKSLQCSKKCSLIYKTIKSTGRKFQKLTIRFSALFFYSKIGQLTNIPDFAYFMKMTKSAPSIWFSQFFLLPRQEVWLKFWPQPALHLQPGRGSGHTWLGSGTVHSHVVQVIPGWDHVQYTHAGQVIPGRDQVQSTHAGQVIPGWDQGQYTHVGQVIPGWGQVHSTTWVPHSENEGRNVFDVLK